MTPTTAEATTTSRSERQDVRPARRPPAGLALVRHLGRVVLLALLAAGPGCSGCEDEEASAAAAASASAGARLAPVPAPDGLLADVFLNDPDGTWRRLRELVGFPATALPASSALFAGTLIGLPGATAGSISGDVPMVGAVIADPRGSYGASLVVGLHVLSGREMVASLTAGKAAAYRVVPAGAGDLTLLEPVAGRAPADVALAVVGNYLLAAPTRELLESAGPYVARTLPRGELPREPIVVRAGRDSLAGPVAELLKRLWSGYEKRLQEKDSDNRRRHGGRSPDFGDPVQAMIGLEGAVDRVVSLLESSEQVRLVVEPSKDHLQGRLELVPRGTGAARELIDGAAVGDVEPMLTLPKRTVLAVLGRSRREDRVESAQSLSEGMRRLMGDRLSERDTARLSAAFAAMAGARGDTIAYGLLPRPPAVVARVEVTSERDGERAAKRLFDLLRIRALADPVRQFVGDVSLRQDSVKIEGLKGDVRRATLTVKPSPMRVARGRASRVDLAPRPVEFLWQARDGVLYGAAASHATDALVDVATAAPGSGETLGAAPGVRQAVERVGKVASFALFAEPIPLGLTGRDFGSEAAPSPLLVVVGRDDEIGWIRFDVGREAFGGLVRQMARVDR